MAVLLGQMTLTEVQAQAIGDALDLSQEATHCCKFLRTKDRYQALFRLIH